MGAKVEFPIGKKLLHLVVDPGTSRCPTVDLALVQTTRKVNGTRHSIRKFQPGKRTHLFRFSSFSGNFPVGRAYETCSIYRRTRNLTKWKAPLVPGGFWERETNPLQFRRDNRQQVGEKCYILCRICGQDRAIYGLSHGFYHWKGLFLVLWHL